MPKNLKSLLNDDYGLDIKEIVSAPRQLVAKTYYVNLFEPSQRYFLKLVDKPLWITKIVRSLPVLQALKDCGIQRIPSPVPTVKNELYVMHDNMLLVLFNLIPGVQSYEYDLYAFGKLLGKIHASTPQINVPIPKDAFYLDPTGKFLQQYHHFLRSESSNTINVKIKQILGNNQQNIEMNLSLFEKLKNKYHPKEQDLVITHGDAGGNVMITTKDALSIIDWDEILLAPPERDLWVLENEPEFMQGYKFFNPDFQVNEDYRDFCILNQYFWYIFYYFEIFLANKDTKDTITMVNSFKDYFDEWIKPYINSVRERH